MASIKLKGDVSGEVTISAPSVAGTTTLELPATSSTLATQNSLGVRNLIINGDMKIAQRATSKTGITGAGYYTCDRFDIGGSGFGTFTQSQDTDVPPAQGFANSIKFSWTTANASLGASSFLQMHQSIEGQNLQYLKKGTSNAQSLTASFWVKSNKTGTYIVNLYDIDNTRVIAKAYTINTADTWEKKTLSFAGDTSGALDNDNGRSFDIAFGLCAGADYSSGTLQTTWASAATANRFVGQVNLADNTANYINITGVQLEVGDTATPFEHRPYDMELQRCQRYYQTQSLNIPAIQDAGYSINYGAVQLPVTMRTAPTTTTSAVTAVGHATGTFDSSNIYVSTLAFQVNSGNTMYRGYGVRWSFAYFASAEL